VEFVNVNKLTRHRANTSTLTFCIHAMLS